VLAGVLWGVYDVQVRVPCAWMLRSGGNGDDDAGAYHAGCGVDVMREAAAGAITAHPLHVVTAQHPGVADNAHIFNHSKGCGGVCVFLYIIVFLKGVG
jgi:hypothetical protein